MKPQPEQKEPKTRRKPTALWYVGMPVMIFGIVTATMFTVRQFKESGTGDTYYEFIAPGVIAAVLGFVLLVISRRSTPRT